MSFESFRTEVEAVVNQALEDGKWVRPHSFVSCPIGLVNRSHHVDDANSSDIEIRHELRAEEYPHWFWAFVNGFDNSGNSANFDQRFYEFGQDLRRTLHIP